MFFYRFWENFIFSACYFVTPCNAYKNLGFYTTCHEYALVFLLQGSKIRAKPSQISFVDGPSFRFVRSASAQQRIELAQMKTYFHLTNRQRYSLPAIFQDDDVRFPESLVEYFLEQYTRKGDVVFDPFAGFGTTLFVAERMGRVPYGVEIDQDRVNFIRSKLANTENIIHGDTRQLADIELPKIDFSITSPPYMNKYNHPQFPFAGYKITGEGYEEYLRDIRSIYQQLRARMKPTGKIVLEVANLKTENQVTTLAWDIGQEISKVLHFEGEVVICWENGYGSGYDHSYCLIFSVQ